MRALLLLIALVACSSEPARAPSPPPVRAFYHWRTTLALTPTETAALTELHAARLYVKVFDVAWQADKPAIVGELTPTSTAPAGVELVPVVFLRNEVFQHGPRPGLALDVWQRVQRISDRLHVAPREFQLDCDWSDGTRDEFFAFLRDVRKLAPPTVALSATIRLHQIKYRERTGVPPVERGMLMFYNMGKFSAEASERAIFDAKTAQSYLARVGDYPLPLDAALPIWAWTLHLRDGAVMDLLQSTDADALSKEDFVEPIAPHRYRVTRTTFLAGNLVREGDELKVESIDPADALAAAKLLAPHLAAAKAPRTITLFDLSDKNLRRHDHHSLDQLFSTVR